ncbi:DNA-entry nuclease, partial [Lactobacillus delbrueckii subsp. bulgaricus]|nr:DNA-entry nuclease [Lactobacillus delbrueckii subsp. bulgaricus]
SYIKSSSRHYIRYRVKPIFRGRELLARGVEMEAQSTGSNAVRFHVYIFNVQDGVKLNYSNGTSVVTGAAKKFASS